LAQLTNVTDARTDGHRVTAYRAYACASRGKNIARGTFSHKVEIAR